MVSREKVQPAMDTLGTMLWFNPAKDSGALRRFISDEVYRRMRADSTALTTSARPLAAAA